MELKQSNAFRVPVRIRSSSTGAGITGISYNQVTVYIQKQAGSSAQKVLTANNTDWFEIDAANFPGVYDLLLSTTDTNILGFFKYAVSYSGATLYYGLLEVVANLESDTYARLGAPAGASISADIAAVQTTDTAIKTKTDNLPANTATALSAIPTNPLLTTDTRLNNLDTTISSRASETNATANMQMIMGSGGTAMDLPTLKTELDAVKAKTDNLPANTATAISAIPTNPLLTNDARIPATIIAAKADVPTPPTAVQVRQEMDANSTKLANLDAAVSSRLAAASYSAPPSAAAIQAQVETTTVLAKKTDIPSVAALATAAAVAAIPTNPLLAGDTRLNHLDADISSRLPASGYTAPDNASIAAIKSEVDDLFSETFGKWVIDSTADTLTLYRTDNSVLKVFQLVRTVAAPPIYVERHPQ